MKELQLESLLQSPFHIAYKILIQKTKIAKQHINSIGKKYQSTEFDRNLLNNTPLLTATLTGNSCFKWHTFTK